MDLNHTRLPIPPPGQFLIPLTSRIIKHVVHGTAPNIHETYAFCKSFFDFFCIFFEFFRIFG